MLEAHELNDAPTSRWFSINSKIIVCLSCNSAFVSVYIILFIVVFSRKKYNIGDTEKVA